MSCLELRNIEKDLISHFNVIEIYDLWICFICVLNFSDAPGPNKQTKKKFFTISADS